MNKVLTGSAPVEGRLDIVRNVRAGSPEQPAVVIAGNADTLLVEGWAVIRESGAAIALTIDGEAYVPLARGFARPDLIATYGPTGRFAGYKGTVPLRSVATGDHVLSVVVSGEQGALALGHVGLRVVDIAPVLPLSNYVTLDEPAQAECRYAFGETIRLTGWAVDPLTRGTMEYVACIVGDRYVVAAVCGHLRSDVSAALELSQPGVGFEVMIASEQLGPGRYDVRAVAFTAGGDRIDGAGMVVVVVQEIPAS